ncbi:NAD(P)-binding protein [Pleurostoma richardsiae]|uniref:NAD(P)-binding protein n=1 Tax=Pleurostoma richardsiae TaxID=41990 RepID=A0AA38RTK3_9PEZI|nr:NAD(P)-binding protein [Pleurostoma richardsiae]
MSAIEIAPDSRVFSDVRDKVVILTGGATGIGAATVRLLNEHGAIVSFLDVNKAVGEELAAELGDNVHFFHGSVTTWEDQLKVFEWTVEKYGRVDIVLANAGIDEVVEDAFADKFDESGKLQAPTLIVLDVTLRGVIFTIKLALSYFRRLKIRGSIVATGSAASYLDTPGIPVYNAAKHGVLGLVRSLRDSLKEEGLIRANVVAPSFTATPFTKNLIHFWRREGLPINEPEQIARAILFLAVNPDYHGKSLYVAAGTYTELEGPILATQEQWLGKQNTAWVNLRKTKNLKMGKPEDNV